LRQLIIVSRSPREESHFSEVEVCGGERRCDLVMKSGNDIKGAVGLRGKNALEIRLRCETLVTRREEGEKIA